MKMPVEDIVYERAARLLAVRNTVADAFGGQKRRVTDPHDLRLIVKLFRGALTAVPGSYGVVVGGLAVQEHGFVRWSEDVAEHHGAIVAHLCNTEFSSGGNGVLIRAGSGAILDVLKEGQRLKDSRLPVPAPSNLGPNRGFARLDAVIRLKLDSGGRMKDQADIVELLKRSLDKIETIETSLPEVLRPDFQRLAAQARRESLA